MALTSRLRRSTSEHGPAKPPDPARAASLHRYAAACIPYSSAYGPPHARAVFLRAVPTNRVAPRPPLARALVMDDGVHTDACSRATWASSAFVTLSRKRRCTRVLTVRSSHVAAVANCLAPLSSPPGEKTSGRPILIEGPRRLSPFRRFPASSRCANWGLHRTTHRIRS